MKFLKLGLWALLGLLAVASFGQDGNANVFSIGDPNSATRGKVNLTGRVVDANSLETVEGAFIQLLSGSGGGAVSDTKGKFQFSLDPGIYDLEIHFLGYEYYRARVAIYKSANLNFEVIPTTLSLEEVTISGVKKDENLTMVMAGVERMSMEDISKQTKFLGETDVLRGLQSISGVSSVGEGSAGFNVRGGNADENLIFQDGNLIMNPVHALGFFSLFHPDLVENVTLYKGGVPAMYGGRLSSVLDVKLREGSYDTYTAKGGLGIASSRLALEGPIIKDKASVLIGGRISYVDWILKQNKNIELQQSEAFFYDLTVKVDARITPTTKVGFSGFASHDDFQFSDQVKFDYETLTGAAYINQSIGERFTLNARANRGRYNSILFDINGNDQNQFETTIDYLRASLSAFYEFSKAYQLEVGVEQNRYDVAPGVLKPLDEFSIVRADELAPEKGVETSPFLSNQVKLGDKLELMIGLRHTMFRNMGPDTVYLYTPEQVKSEITIVDSLVFGENEVIARYSGLSPRLSLRYKIDERSSVKIGYNRSYQFINQISNTASATPIDIWQLSNYHIEPQRADNFSVGYYRNFRENTIRSELTAFYRDIQNLIDYRDFAELLLNHHIETELITGRGRAYGLEFAFNKDYGKHKFDMNYTYSRSLRQVMESATQTGVNNGQWYPSNYDKPHVFNLTYVFNAGPITELSVNFTYSTGRPTTAPVSIYANGNILSIPVYSERNQYRIPDYHRMDVAYTIGPWGKADRENSITLSVYNLYGRDNAFSVFFTQNPFQSVSANRVAVLGSIFPAITYNFKY